MSEENEIVLRIPAPSDGIETVLVLFGVGLLLLVVLTGLHHRETVARIWDWLKSHPWERASAPVNLLSWPVLIFVGPVAAVLFVMAVGEAHKLLQHTGGSGSGVGSLGRGAVIVALIGAPFVIWRSVVAQKTVNVTEQGHITDRINTAVQGLGAEKTVKLAGSDEETAPNLEVRIGAIYALERIAQDSDRDHVQIMEILCAYIRQNAPAPAEDDWPELEIYESEKDGPLEADWDERLKTFREKQDEKKAGIKLRDDIQFALTVIGRRTAKQRRLEAGRGVEAVFPFDTPCPEFDELGKAGEVGASEAHLEKLKDWDRQLEEYRSDPKRYQLDMRSTDLRGADMSTGNFKGARLNGSRLEKADLWEACFQGAVFRGARLQGAELEGTHLQGAVLGGADLHGANLKRARLQCAKLWETRLIGVLLKQVQLREVSLEKLEFDWAYKGDPSGQGSTLEYVGKDGLAAAQLHGAALRETDCTFAKEIQEHLKRMFGDASVTLPGGHGPEDNDWPPHWPRFKLDGSDFDAQWREWQADPAGYRPPDPPKPSETA